MAARVYPKKHRPDNSHDILYHDDVSDSNSNDSDSDDNNDNNDVNQKEQRKQDEKHEEHKVSQNICDCGYPKDRHHMRHRFTGNILVTSTASGGFLINVENFHTVVESGNCIVPQCGRNKYMHDSGIFQHPFQGEEHKSRHINFMFPSNTPCIHENCGISYEKHNENGAKHPFRTEISFSQKSDHDIINIFSEDGLKLDFEWDKNKNFVQILHK